MNAIIKYNSLFFFFILTQLIVVFLGMQEDKIIGDNVKFSNAILYHFLGLLFFTLGYIPFSKKKFLNYEMISRKQLFVSNNFYFSSYFFAIIGTVTSIATIGSVISPTEYLKLLFGGSSNLMDIRYESGAEGLNGIFKMMNYFPVGIFLISNSFVTFFELSILDRKKMNRLIIFATFSCIVKVFFSLDRLTLLAMVLVFFYQNFLIKKVKLKYVIYILGIFLLLSFITASRMKDVGVMDFLITYFKLSIANFELVIENQKQNSYGFNTFLMPIWYIMKFFGIDYKIPEPEYWVWNPAQYFASYLYIDFGLFSFFIFFIIGQLIRKIQVKTIQGSIRYTSIYFIVLFVLVTFISVPIIRGIEFWLMLSLSLFLSKKVKILKQQKN